MKWWEAILWFMFGGTLIKILIVGILLGYLIAILLK